MGRSKADAIAIYQEAGRDGRSGDESGQGDDHRVCRTRGRRDQEERHGRVTRHRPVGARGSQGSPGPQSGHRRNHQDSGQEGREVPRGQGRQRRDRSAEKEVFWGPPPPPGATSLAHEPRFTAQKNPAWLTARAGFAVSRKPIEAPSKLRTYAGKPMPGFLVGGVVGGSPFKESLPCGMPSPKPLATSGLFSAEQKGRRQPG